MYENPYEAPQTDTSAVGVLSGTREDLRSVARFQKGILICILTYLLMAVGQFAFPANLRPVIGLCVAVVALVGAVFVFLLAIKVYGAALGIVLGLLCIVPLLGLIVLLVVNGKATRVLQQNRIRVGLLGAKLSDI